MRRASYYNVQLFRAGRVVWPGYGPRARARYGEPIGRSTFIVRR